jgi:metal-responsive CopG/Arc/MetJ family transcriptional regulator
MVKTTIDLEDELWKKFSIKVIQDYGGRKKNDIIQALISEFVSDPSKTIEEALQNWEKRKKKQ